MASCAPDRTSAASLRPLRIRRGFTRHAEGSALVQMGRTHVLCNATVEERVPDFLRESGRGWVTAEYQMLPRSTLTRTPREAKRGRQGGRTLEISRLVGRSLRAAVDLAGLPGVTVIVDCDVLQADGGTRCASICGGMVALVDALRWMRKHKLIKRLPLLHLVGAVSVGLVEGRPVLDLCYDEDHRAQVDLNVVMTATGRFVEVQGTAEGAPFSQAQLTRLTRLAAGGIREIIRVQKKVLRLP